MSIYAIIYLVLAGISLLIVANKHGQDRVDPKYSIWLSLFSTGSTMLLLYLGGFFN